MPLRDFVAQLSNLKGNQIALDVYVELLPHEIGNASTEQAKHPGTESIFGIANAVRDYISPATDYRWSQKKRRELANGGGTVVTYYCSQLEGEQSKHVQKTPKALGWRFGIMDRYHCNGWLHITVPKITFDGSLQRVRIRITHDLAHPPPPKKPDVRDGRGRFVPGNRTLNETIVNAVNVYHGRSEQVTSSETHTRTQLLHVAHQDAEINIAHPPSSPSSTGSPATADIPLPDSSDARQANLPPQSSDLRNQGEADTLAVDVKFSRDFLMGIGRDVDTILHKALAGVDNERASQFNTLFLQLRQLGETIRAENRAVGALVSNLQPPQPP